MEHHFRPSKHFPRSRLSQRPSRTIPTLGLGNGSLQHRSLFNPTTVATHSFVHRFTRYRDVGAEDRGSFCGKRSERQRAIVTQRTTPPTRKEQRGKSGENRRQRRELSPGSILVIPLSVPAAVFVRPVLSSHHRICL